MRGLTLYDPTAYSRVTQRSRDASPGLSNLFTAAERVLATEHAPRRVAASL